MGYKDYRDRYADLRFAFYWAKEAKEITSLLDDSHENIKEAARITYGYIKKYCDTIDAESK